MLRTFLNIFKNKKYLLLVVILTIVILSLIVWFQNRGLLFGVAESLGFIEAMKLSFLLYGSILSNNTVFSAVGLVLTAILFSINIALFIYFARRRAVGQKHVGAKRGIAGFVVGVLGVGCASCGSLVFASVLSFFGLGSLLSFLPFGGEEFIVVGIVFLGFSIFDLLKKISGPITCKV